jgi:hypothetical protein
MSLVIAVQEHVGPDFKVSECSYEHTNSQKRRAVSIEHIRAGKGVDIGIDADDEADPSLFIAQSVGPAMSVLRRAIA